MRIRFITYLLLLILVFSGGIFLGIQISKNRFLNTQYYTQKGLGLGKGQGRYYQRKSGSNHEENLRRLKKELNLSDEQFNSVRTIIDLYSNRVGQIRNRYENELISNYSNTLTNLYMIFTEEQKKIYEKKYLRK